MKRYNYIKLEAKPFWDLVEIAAEIISKGIDCISIKMWFGLKDLKDYFSSEDIEKLKHDLIKYYEKELGTEPDITDLDFVCYMAICDNNAYPMYTFLREESEEKVKELLQINFELNEIISHIK